MKILHVIPSVATEKGGPSQAIAMIERALSAAGHDIVTVSTADEARDSRKGQALGVPVPCNGATRFYFPRQTRLYEASWPMLTWLRRNIRRFDVVHAHALFSFAPVSAAMIARHFGVPYVIRPLGVLNRYGMTQRRSRLKSISLHLLEGRLLRDAAAVHFTSELERREAESLGIEMRAAVLPLGVEPVMAATPDRFMSAHPGIADSRKLLYLSRLDPKKNLEGLLAALAIARKDMPDLCLLVCGDGEAGYVAGLKQLAEQLRLGEAVVWAGHVDGDMKASAFAAADAYVLPSFSENFGIAPVEALSAGLPCILGAGVAIAKEIAQAGAGSVVEPDGESIARAVLTLFRDDGARLAAGENARALAKRAYAPEAMAGGLATMYARILASDKQETNGHR